MLKSVSLAFAFTNKSNTRDVCIILIHLICVWYVK